MSKKLAVLLGRPQDTLLHVALADLEKSTGRHALDAKLLGDILRHAHAVIRRLGLEGDVTAREVYQALRVYVASIDESTRFVGIVIDGEVVSFNYDDISADIASKTQFAARSLMHLREELTSEIITRYTEQSSHPKLLRQTIKYLTK